MTDCDLPEADIRITIASTPAHLRVVRSALERICTMMGFDEEQCGGIVLSLDEALSNVIRHAYHGDPNGRIEITFRPTYSEGGGELGIEVRDWGDTAGPEDIKSRDLDDVRPGGLGVHIMNSCMDEVTYTPAEREGEGTVLTMLKKSTRRECCE